MAKDAGQFKVFWAVSLRFKTDIHLKITLVLLSHINVKIGSIPHPFAIDYWVVAGRSVSWHPAWRKSQLAQKVACEGQAKKTVWWVSPKVSELGSFIPDQSEWKGKIQKGTPRGCSYFIVLYHHAVTVSAWHICNGCGMSLLCNHWQFLLGISAMAKPNQTDRKKKQKTLKKKTRLHTPRGK